MTNEIFARFNLIGFSQDPEEVTEFLQVVPTRIWRIGEARAPKLAFKENGWQLSSSLAPNADLEEQVLDLLSRLDPVGDKIVNLGTYREFLCVVYAYEYAPEMHFQTETLRRIAALGADIDIDFYPMEGADREKESSLT